MWFDFLDSSALPQNDDRADWCVFALTIGNVNSNIHGIFLHSAEK